MKTAAELQARLDVLRKDFMPNTETIELIEEILRLREAQKIAFIQGAKWWEWIKEKATMWQADQRSAALEADKRADAGTLGIERIPR